MGCVRACVRSYERVVEGSGKTLIKMQHQDLVEGHNFDIFSLVVVLFLLYLYIFYCESTTAH